MELTSVQPRNDQQEEVAYYNAVSGVRVSEALSTGSGEYTDVTPNKGPYTWTPSRASLDDGYEDTTVLSRGESRPRIEEFDDDDYENTIPPTPSNTNMNGNEWQDFTIQRPQAYEDTPQTLTRTIQPESDVARFEYEDIPALMEKSSLSRQKPVRQREDIDLPPMKQKKRRCDGPNWRRVMVLLMILLLVIIIAAVVYISLLQRKVQELQIECNVTSSELSLFS